MHKYKVTTNPRLEEYLHTRGFIPILTTPVAHTKDVWKYTYENSAYLEIEIEKFYKKEYDN